jgi:hypothetical protein
MRMPAVRFTIRRMMVAVAIVGVMLWTTLWLGTRIRAYRWMAQYHAVHRWTVPMAGPPGTAPRGVDSRGEVTSADRNRWHAALEAKYLRAAQYPWLSIEPDPPEPK